MGGLNHLLLTIGLAACLLLAFFWAPDAWADDDLIGLVKTVEGDAVLVRGDTTVPATVGTEVHRKDRLRTGGNGAAGVTLNDGTLISLGPNSLFEFSEFEYAPRRGAFEFLGSMLGGTMLYSSGKVGKLAPERTRIKTPISVIAVRGTRFGVRLPAVPGP